MLQVVDRARQQSGADQQGERQRQLQADQESAGAHLAQRPDGAAALLQARSGVGFGRLPRWEHAEQQCGANGDGQDERQHQRVQREIHVKARIRFRQHSDQRAMNEVGNGDGRHTADGGEGQTLGDELADDAFATCAERQTQRDFWFAGSAAREQEVGEIGAGDEQQDAHCCQKGGQRLRQFVAFR